MKAVLGKQFGPPDLLVLESLEFRARDRARWWCR